MINFKQLNLVLLSIFLSSSLGSILCAQQATSTYQRPSGQIIDGTVVQGQRIIQGQVFQGQVIQGQPIQGQVIQGQPVQGQVIQGQPFIQGPVIQGRPIRGNVVQPQPIAPPQANQQQSIEQQKAAAAARAKIEALTAENSRLSRVEDTNNAMRQEYARLKEAYENVSKEFDELKMNQAMKTAEPADTGAQDAKLNQLNAQYEEAVKQSRMLSGQMEALTQENTEIKNRLKDLSSSSVEMTGFEEKLNTANNKITEIEQQNQILATENNRLNSGNEKLNLRFSTLSEQSEQLTQTNTTLRDQVTNLSSQNRDYLASLNSRPATVQPARTNIAAAPDDSGLTAERDQVLALNSDLESKNALLMEQVSDLEAKIGSVDKTTAPLAVSLPAVTSDPTSKFNIMNWLIPFLLIGLTIGLYVFLTEERGGEVASGFTSARLQPNQDTDRH